MNTAANNLVCQNILIVGIKPKKHLVRMLLNADINNLVSRDQLRSIRIFTKCNQRGTTFVQRDMYLNILIQLVDQVVPRIQQ